ncbi:sulfurtransferase [Thermogemmatispora carboxidivorans]|uniref:sulfurtransferase n=1 Tax=Thermogemmatispora carboxidivorans TaxID=1382306 RepID=UPI00069C15AD|nr:sulfurtransferase [Thermogemmatispora carboxidivorans]
MMSEQRERLLVEPAWLEEHLRDPRLRIVDMRGYVRTVERGAGEQEAVYEGARAEYEQGHIPGAVYLDWTSDIVDPASEVKAQVAPPERFAEVLGRLGIGDEHVVVAYDAHPASQFATRLWWALTYYGHREVRVLNGGFPRWLREGRPLTTEVPQFPPAIFTPRVQPELRATAEEVLAALGRAGVRVIDARDVGQYSGQVVRQPGRRGHIPGAINIPREELVDPQTGQFRSNEELAAVFARAGVHPEEQVIAYCNGGVAATVVLFSLALLGYPHLTNYDGSWNEWGVRPDLPTEV